jgi:hypothetical protein
MFNIGYFICFVQHSLYGLVTKTWVQILNLTFLKHDIISI